MSPIFPRVTSVIIKTTRTLSTSTKTYSSSHYDVLGITPKANQRDIKAAYYKLSKVYHPDKSNDDESAKKFRAITEAYEVLGNVQLKKIYDKGMFVGRHNAGPMEYKPEPEPTDPSLKFYKSRSHKNYAATIDGTTPIYNFDAWSRSHYANIFKQSQYEKKFQKKRSNIQKDLKMDSNQELVAYTLLGISGLFIFMVMYGKDDYDVVQKEVQNAKGKGR